MNMKFNKNLRHLLHLESKKHKIIKRPEFLF